MSGKRPGACPQPSGRGICIDRKITAPDTKTRADPRMISFRGEAVFSTILPSVVLDPTFFSDSFSKGGSKSHMVYSQRFLR